MPKMTLKQFRETAGSSMFTVVFKRKNDGKNGEKAGDERTMTARFNVPATRKPAETRLNAGERAAEDAANNVLTCYDMNKWDEKNDERSCFRRINLAGLVRLSFKRLNWTWDNDQQLWVA